MIADNVINHLTGGFETITGLHGDYWVFLNFVQIILFQLRMRIEQINDTYIKPYIMNKREAKFIKIVKKNEELQVFIFCLII